MGALIAFSGVDCSGKTTQLERLATALEAGGTPVRTLWYRPGYSDALDGARALARRVLGRAASSALPTSDSSASRERAFARPGVSAAWIVMATVDAMLQYGARVRLWLAQGHTVLVDRYLADAALDLRFRFPQHPALVEAALATLNASSPRPDQHLLLMLSPEMVAARAAAKDEPFPDSDEVRAMRRAAYDALAADGSMTVIDAAGSIDDVHQRILAVLPSSVR